MHYCAPRSRGIPQYLSRSLITCQIRTAIQHCPEHICCLILSTPTRIVFMYMKSLMVPACVIPHITSQSNHTRHIAACAVFATPMAMATRLPCCTPRDLSCKSIPHQDCNGFGAIHWPSLPLYTKTQSLKGNWRQGVLCLPLAFAPRYFHHPLQRHSSSKAGWVS